LSLSTATEAACLAASTGWRIGSLSTKVLKRMVEVTAASAPISVKGSMKGLSSRNSRLPSGV
jgi:hypothetical protein